MIAGKLPAQYHFFLHKTYPEKVAIIDTFYARVVWQSNKAKSLVEIKALTEFGRQHHDRELELEGELLGAYFYTLFKLPGMTKEDCIDRLKTIAEKGRKEGYLHIEARALRVMAEFFWRRMGDYEQAFENYLLLNDRIATSTPEAFPNMAEYYYLIGEPYFFFKDYTNTIQFMHKALAIPETAFNWKARWSACNTLGLCYQRLQQLDSSNFYFNKALTSSFITPQAIQYTIAQGNLGQNYCTKGLYQEAMPLVKADYDNAVVHLDYSLASNAALLLANISIKTKNSQAAQNWLQAAWLNIIQSERPYELKPAYYTATSNWHTLNDHLANANLYLDSSILAKDSLDKVLNPVFIARAEQKAYRQKLRAEQEKLSLLNKVKNTQLFTAIVIIFFVVFMAVFIYYTQKKKRLIHQQVSEALLHTKEQELENARLKLLNFTNIISEKNSLIETLHSQEVNSQVIEQLQQTAILTENDWLQFKQAFEKIYPAYIKTISTMIPGITPAEIRLMVLSKLKLSRTEMANSLGISPQSIRVTWHRLRKKISSGEDLQLEEFANSI
jgi:DNA-binding CsgD family transcriptional regulator